MTDPQDVLALVNFPNGLSRRMTNRAADFPNAPMRWLIEAMGLPSLEAILTHLCQGWLEFTPAAAVLVGQQIFSHADAVFDRAGQAPLSFLNQPPGDDSSELLNQLAPLLPVDDLTRQPLVPLEWDHQPVGHVWLWTSDIGADADADEELEEEPDWLKEACARLLADWQRREENFQSAKLSALAEFAAGAGHEINNPVATISGRVQGLLRSETDPQRRRQLLTIGGQALRIRDMIGDTMLFARPPLPAPEWLDLQVTLPDITAPLQSEITTQGATLDTQLPQSVPIFADRSQLAVVVTELLRNSLDAFDQGGHIQLTASAITTPAGPAARIVIEDDGPSFPPEHELHLFDPFFSGRQAGRGLGFGLPKCWRIVSNHQGRIDITSLPQQGTRTTVIWPAYDFLSNSP